MIFRRQKIKPDAIVKEFSSLKLPHSLQQGFTLLEVIVALGIVAVGILAVSKAMSGHATTLSESEKRMTAYWVAANQLDYSRITKIPPVAGEKSGRVDMGGQTWFYREKTSATADTRLFRVEIKVFTDENGQDEVGYLFGYRLVPRSAP